MGRWAEYNGSEGTGTVFLCEEIWQNGGTNVRGYLGARRSMALAQTVNSSTACVSDLGSEDNVIACAHKSIRNRIIRDVPVQASGPPKTPRKARMSTKNVRTS
jgi:hypothetical protein